MNVTIPTGFQPTIQDAPTSPLVGLAPVLPFGDSANEALSPAAQRRQECREHLTRFFFASHKPHKVDRDFKLAAPLKRGWLLPMLLDLDSKLWGRWNYWLQCAEHQRLPDEPIPQIRWELEGSIGQREVAKYLEYALEHITPGQHWHSWGTWEHYNYFLDWLLFGFGHLEQEPPEPQGFPGASARLYQAFDLGPLLLFPTDHLGNLLAENAHGRHVAFFPTPMNVCQLMAQMIMGEGDCRAQTTCDPCVGTGRMLLAASNYSMRLFAQDINPTVIKTCLVNGYLYAPWLVKPLAFLGDEDARNAHPDFAPAISNNLAAIAAQDPRTSGLHNWVETEHDPKNQPVLHPIKVRRPKKTSPEWKQYELEFEGASSA